jgi:hypothetical protein
LKKSTYNQHKIHLANPYDLRRPYCNTKVWEFDYSFDFEKIDCKLFKLIINKMIQSKIKQIKNEENQHDKE